jgi:hypothetical protein
MTSPDPVRSPKPLSPVSRRAFLLGMPAAAGVALIACGGGGYANAYVDGYINYSNYGNYANAGACYCNGLDQNYEEVCGVYCNYFNYVDS